MVVKTIRSLIALMALLSSMIFFFAFVTIAIDYSWSFTTQINFGELNGSPVLGPVWIPLALCLILALGFLALLGRQVEKILPRKSKDEVRSNKSV